MKGAGLPKLYDVLEPDERFRLVLEAWAREDETEVDRLERTCPRESYTMPDAAYLDRRDLAASLVLAVCLDLTQHIAKLEVMAAFASVLGDIRALVGDRAADGAYRAARHGAGKRTGDIDGLDELLEATALGAGEPLACLERTARKLSVHCAAKAREVWGGFARFCQAELEVPPETVMGALFAPMLGRLDSQREVLHTAEPDPTTVDEYARTLTEGWRRVLGLEGLPNDDKPTRL